MPRGRDGRGSGATSEAARGGGGDRLLRRPGACDGRGGARMPSRAQLRAGGRWQAPARHVSIARRYRGRTWVTRKGVFVDRMASAWLIRRFIDPDARFKFVRRTRYRATPKGELRFDMFEGEFTHEGDRCTFETLLDRFALARMRRSRDRARSCTTSISRTGSSVARDARGSSASLAGIAAAHAGRRRARLERAAPAVRRALRVCSSSDSEVARSSDAAGRVR